MASPPWSRQIASSFSAQMYSPSAGSETPVALALSDRYELAGAAVSHGGYDPASASGTGGTDDGADVDDGAGSESLIAGAPEAQPATRTREASAVAVRRFIDAQTRDARSWFRTVVLPDCEALRGKVEPPEVLEVFGEGARGQIRLRHVVAGVGGEPRDRLGEVVREI